MASAGNTGSPADDPVDGTSDATERLPFLCRHCNANEWIRRPPRAHKGKVVGMTLLSFFAVAMLAGGVGLGGRVTSGPRVLDIAIGGALGVAFLVALLRPWLVHEYACARCGRKVVHDSSRGNTST